MFMALGGHEKRTCRPQNGHRSVHWANRVRGIGEQQEHERDNHTKACADDHDCSQPRELHDLTRSGPNYCVFKGVIFGSNKVDIDDPAVRMGAHVGEFIRRGHSQQTETA
jgi:hypothetical protein